MQIAEMNPATMNLVELKLGDRVIARMNESVAASLLTLFENPGQFVMAEVDAANRQPIGTGVTEEVPIRLHMIGHIHFNHIARRI